MSPPPPFVEYPRPGFSPARGPGVYFESIGEAWTIVRQNLGDWVAATVVLFVLSIALLLPIIPLTQSMMPVGTASPDFMMRLLVAFGVQLLLSLVPMIVQQILMVGMISMGVRKLRGEYINVGMVFEPFRRFGTLSLTTLLYTLVLYASGLACGLPALFFGPVLVLMPTVAYLKGVSPVEALSLTFDHCRSHWLSLLGLLIVAGLVAALGGCACLVGVLVTYPIFFVVLAIHYRAFFESDPALP